VPLADASPADVLLGLPSLRKNVLANYIGSGWMAAMGVVFLPLYLKVLGAATYGLIGVFALLQGWMALLDLGLTPTLNREMARLRAGAHTPQSVRELLRALEGVYAVMSVCVVAAVWVAAPLLTASWLKVGSLSPTLVTESLRLMGLVVAIRWLEQVYRGALQGLQDLIWLNSRQALLATARWAGAYAVVLVRPSITAFFLWQGAISLLGAVMLMHRTYRQLPVPPRRTMFRFSALHDVRVFASGMFLSSVLGFALTQTDKLAVSKLLPLADLGYYMLASALAGGLLQLMAPLNTAVYPRLTEQAELRDIEAMRRTYHTSCEWMAAVIVPPSLLLAFFARPVLLFWTRDLAVATATAPILTVLALGTMCYGFMNLPYMLQLAHGWTGLAVGINIVAAAVIVPLIVWAVPRYGAIGAAYGWLLLNVGYVVMNAHLMHRRLLPGGKGKWYRDAIARPVLAGSAVCGAFLLLWPSSPSQEIAALTLGLAALTVFASVVAVLPTVRPVVTRLLVGQRRVGAG
jgi:O-antigen/teichoic acid export membrane protein